MQGTKPGVGRHRRPRSGRAVYATDNPHCTSASFLRDFGLVELTGAARERYLADRNQGSVADSWRGIVRCALRALRWTSTPKTSTSSFPNHLAVAPTGHATQVHRSACHCTDLTTACHLAPSSKEVYRAAATELAHPSPCSSWIGRSQHELRGTSACVTVQLTVAALPTEPVANTFGREFFSGSPQEHAVLNRHLLDYFAGRRRAQETTPYNIPASQRHLLQGLGMEEPPPDAPEVPHALHKCIEEGQMRRVARFLPEGAYGLISVKDAKHHLLPRYGSIQNPVHQAQDAHRYPGSAIRSAHFHDHAVYFAHDVSSEVGPHELVERLDKDNPNAHLFVTGMNPAEILERAGSFEPASHEITYDFGKFNYVFTGSESESYTTDIAVTESWLNHSSLRASSGTVYQIVLLEEKLGHCVWHVFAGDMEEQHTRTFSTGSFVKLPGAITGTFRAEWLPTKLVANILAFVDRTQDLSPRNLAAKVTQLATATTPRLTSRELWIARYIAAERAPSQSWAHVASRSLWRTLYVMSFQWHLLAPQPDIYNFVDERQRFITVKPTMGGGWSWSCKSTWRRDAIPNDPSWLQRVSVFTSAAFTFLAPKILIGEVISMAVMHLPLGSILSHLYSWADLKPLRLMLTAAVVVVTAVLPGHVIRVFTRLASHFWRQLWWPGWLGGLFDRVVTEICGGPGATLFATLPGRGWAMQAYLWALGLCSVLPGLVPNFILPWVAIHTPLGFVLAAWYSLILMENLLALTASSYPVTIEDVGPSWCYDLADWCRDFYESNFDGSEPSLLVCLQRFCVRAVWHGKRVVSWLGRHVRAHYVRQGCAQGPFVPLPATVAPVAPVVRDRNVDRTLPPVVLQTARIPAARGAGVVAVDPAGMGFQDWFTEVQRAYLADTAKYPPLTPGQCCFWDCVSILGGTPHMWYSWYMAFTGSRVDPADPVVGHVTQTDILRFATSSRIGVNMAGVTEFVVASADSWPTVSLVMTYQSATGLYHVENAGTPALDPATGNLAVLVKTISIRWPVWHRALIARFNRTPLDAVPQPTPWLRAVMGNMPMCRTRGEVADAILGSPAASHIDPEAPGDYRLDQLAVYDADGPDLFDFNAPNRGNAIASTTPAGMWAKFTNRDGRLFVAQSGAKVGARRLPDSDNREAHNVRPEVPQWTVLRNELAGRLSEYQDVSLPAVPLQEEILSYTADVDRAARLVADLRAHPSALESFADKSVIQGLNSIIDSYKASGASVTTRVRAYVGVWGCGKTTATIAYLKSLSAEERSQVRVVSHTESLRAKSKLALDFPELRGFNFPTTASVLTEPASGPLVFDDAGKFWGGVLDLVLLANPLVTEVVINGDPAQGMSRFPVGGTQSLFDLTPIQCVSAHVTRYATITHRGFRLLSDTFGVHTSNPVEGHITHTIGPKRGIPVLTASPRYVGVLSANGREAYTYGDVQGEDFKTDVEIDMTGLEGAVLDRAAYVALTRSSTGCYLHLEAANPSSVIRRPPTGSDVMNALIYAMREGGCSRLTRPSALVKAAFYRHLHESMPSLVWFGRVGASLGAAAYSLVANFAEAAVVDEHAVDEPGPDEVTPSATPPVDTLVHETHWTAKEDREVAGRGGATDQFKDNAFVNPHVHHRRDTATYFLSVQRRLKTMSAKANARRMARCPRQDMCDEFDRLVPSVPQWSANKHAEYCDRAFREYERTRSEAAIRAKLAAHDPLRTGADIVISLKNQVIKKEEKRYKNEAIPGQLIHEYDISQTLADAPYALYMEDNVISAFPDNFLFYRRMNPDQFIKAYQGRWRVDNGVHTSDVTRWDVGCDAGVLNFDVHVMHRAGFPRQYIEAYVERRLTSRSQHGPMATMQNSGDRYTWALNSIRRAVVTSLINGIKPEDTVVVNGDDGAVDRFCDVAHFPDSQWEFKSQNGMRGEFSGFELGGVTPQYSAPGLWYRSLILESRDPSAQNRWLNYMGLLAHADLDTPEAHAVASLAHKHMDPDTFSAMLPGPLASYF